MLTPAAAARRRRRSYIDQTGGYFELPTPVADVMARAALLMAKGRQVSVVADDEMLTTQGAAELLEVSQRYVVRLVDSATLPAVKVGSHRRLPASDVEAIGSSVTAPGMMCSTAGGTSEEIGGYRFDR